MCFGVQLPLECEELGPSPLFIDFQLGYMSRRNHVYGDMLCFQVAGCDVTHVCDRGCQ